MSGLLDFNNNMRRILCIFGWHRYRVVKVTNYIDTSYDLEVPGSFIVSHCNCCGKIKTDSLWGTGELELEDFND